MSNNKQDGIEKTAKSVEALVKAVIPLFRGKSVQVQGAALADLLALWLAGHVNRDDPAASDGVRKQMLELHLQAVWALVPLNFEEYVEPQLRRGRTGEPG